jgi:hypothetical protein
MDYIATLLSAQTEFGTQNINQAASFAIFVAPEISDIKLTIGIMYTNLVAPRRLPVT